jgi:hypothetical protein
MMYVSGLYDCTVRELPLVDEDINPVFPSHKIRVIQVRVGVEGLSRARFSGLESPYLVSNILTERPGKLADIAFKDGYTVRVLSLKRCLSPLAKASLTEAGRRVPVRH